MAMIKTPWGQATVDVVPDQCPICLHNIHPIDGQASATGNWIEKVFECPRKQCERLFIARYAMQPSAGGGAVYSLRELIPLTIRTTDQTPVIKGISQDFTSIYAEAEKAELLSLKLICGPGYRKALEFLIKDYVIRSHPNDAETIKKQLLAKCITDYVTDTKVKQVAARAVWLGNDETHYLRKWGDKDLQDLKLLIKLTLHWIEMDELTQAALTSMPTGKP
jgi:hypothetical protein